MSVITLPNTITSKDLISFDLFPVANAQAATELVPLKNLEASDKILNYAIRHIKWSGYSYTSIDKKTKIGYNLSVETEGDGLTESSAYNLWIDDWKEKERKFKKIFPLDACTQSQYDGLLSLYYFTGEFASVGTEIRKFKLSEYIQNRQWEYVATAMTLAGGKNRVMRQGEAKIIMLADYGIPKDRTLIKEQGLQELVKKYPDRFISDKAKAQAEYVYFAETKRFLPNMSESRKRLLAQLLK